jgi:hypothetical protein
MDNMPFFDNLRDFLSPAAAMSYWSWQDFARSDTRQVMKWHTFKNSPADYLRAKAYSGDVDFSIIGKDYAHVSPMGTIEWSWPIQIITRWRINIEMRFIYPQCQNQQVVELWQDDVLLWRRGFTPALPVADSLILDTDNKGGELRLLVLNETEKIAYGKFVYRLKLYPLDSHDAEPPAQLLLPQKNRMFSDLINLPPDLQRKLYEKECATDHLTAEEKLILQQAVAEKALHQLNLTERIFGESGFFKLK